MDMQIPTQITWDPVTTGLLGLLVYLLRKFGEALVLRVIAHDELLKKVVTEEDCEKAQKECVNCPDWQQFHRHYHTDNGPNSGVVVKE